MAKLIKYRKEFCDELYGGLRCDGFSVPEVCARWGIAPKTYYSWVKTKPAFKEAHEFGVRDAAAWWYQLTRKAATGEVKANAGIICFALKNIEGIGWSDKVEVQQTIEENVNLVNIKMLPTHDEMRTIEHDDSECD